MAEINIDKVVLMRVESAIRSVEAMLNELKELRTIVSGDLENVVLEEIKANGRIAAIKLHRQHTGSTLKDALSYINCVAAKYGAHSPNGY